MFATLTAAIGLVLSLAVHTPATAEHAFVALEEWQVEAGDQFVVDLSTNMGYLVHEDGMMTEFTVATGRKQTVTYIGMTYYAETPARSWEVQTRHEKGDRITFGKSGRFLRLYMNGEERTSYGIHSYIDIDEVLSWDAEDRYFSMGCVLVTEHVMDILEETYDANGGSIQVTTVESLAQFNE